MTEHMPQRPGWDCLACGQPWPCAPAKVQLGEEYQGQGSGLMLYLHLQLNEAIKEHDWDGAENLYDRIVGWAREVIR
jgi:hypothetical protein